MDFCGTGFIAAPHVAVTCHHVVEGPLSEGEFYALVDASAVTYKQTAPGRAWRLYDIAQHIEGHDLVVARVDCDTLPVGPIAAEPVQGVGFDVGTFAYPGTWGVHNDSIGAKTHNLQGRYLQGYVTRGFAFERPGNESVAPSWELDITAPGGASGAPLFILGPHPQAGQIAGVVYSRYPAFTDTSEGTLVKEPPVWFSVAYNDEVLRSLSGPATAGRTLAKVLTGAKPV